MDWKMKEENDYRIFCHLGDRRYLFANECLFPGKGYSAAIYYVDLDHLCSNEQIDDASMMLASQEVTDEDKAYVIADEMDDCDFQTECFSDEESMWNYVRENVIEVMGL